MFKLQPSCIVFEIADVRAIIHIKQDDDDSDQEGKSDDVSEHGEESTLSSDIEDDNLDNQQVVQHLDQACQMR
jgi:hypothetical protein